MLTARGVPLNSFSVLAGRCLRITEASLAFQAEVLVGNCLLGELYTKLGKMRSCLRFKSLKIADEAKYDTVSTV